MNKGSIVEAVLQRLNHLKPLYKLSTLLLLLLLPPLLDCVVHYKFTYVCMFVMYNIEVVRW